LFLAGHCAAQAMTETIWSDLEALRLRARERGAPGVEPSPSFADRAADVIAAVVGSWRFIIVQSTLLVGWIVYNSMSGAKIDPFPFILLNLMLSFQAAYTAPIIMMSQNRQADIDRRRSVADYEINRKAELEIETLHEKIDLLREQEIARLTASVENLTRLLAERRGDQGAQ
jgi:uncharacterized membrane protein